MTLSIVPVDAAGIDNLAEGLTGFVEETDELQESMMTTLFISGASTAVMTVAHILLFIFHF